MPEIQQEILYLLFQQEFDLLALSKVNRNILQYFSVIDRNT